MNLMELSAVLSLDKRGFEQGAKQAEREGKTLGQRLQNIMDNAVGHMIANAATGLWQTVKSVSRRALDLTGELEQQIGGAQNVFGIFFKDIMIASTTAYKTMGMSQNAFLQGANKMGSLLQGMGIEQGKSAEMSIKWMTRAADVASIMGVDINDAMVAVQGAAKGNFTMMDNLGVAMNATTLDAYALEKGYGKTFSTMTQGEKIMLAYTYFMEKTERYTSNYAKENNTLSGSLSSLKAAWENLLTGVSNGEEMQDFSEEFADIAANAFEQISKTAAELLPRLFTSFKKLFVRLWPKVTQFIGGIIQDLPANLSKFLTGFANGAIDIINSVFGTKIPHIKDIRLPSWGELRDKVTERINGIIAKINALLGLKIPKIQDIRIPKWEDIQKFAIDTLNDIIRGINAFFGTNIPEITEFGLPDVSSLVASVSEWWKTSDIGQLISDTCKWFLGIFQSPAENLTPEKVRSILGKWWDTAKTVVSAACSWVLGVFTSVDGDEKTVASQAVKWWNEGGFGKVVGNACSWLLQIFGFDTEGAEAAGNKIAEKWNKSGLAKTISNSCEWFLKLPELPPNESGQKFGSLVEEWLDSILELTNWGYVLPGPDVPSDADSATIAESINTWWKTKVKPDLDIVVDFVVGFMGYNSIEEMTVAWGNAINEFFASTKRDFLRMLVDFIEPLHDLLLLFGVDTFDLRMAIQEMYENDIADNMLTLGPNGEVMHAITDAVGEAANRPGNKLLVAEDAAAREERTANQSAAGLSEVNTGITTAQKFNALMNLVGLDEVGHQKNPALYSLLTHGIADFEGIMDAFEGGEEIPEETQQSIVETAINLMQLATESTEARDALNLLNGTSVDTYVTNHVTTVEDGAAPGNAKGLDYVPYNDYLTRLHKGETILSGNEARAWREQGGRGQSYGGSEAVVAAIQGLSADMQNLRLYVGERAFAGAVVDYSGRRLDGFIGASENRRRRGYGRR